MRFGDLVCTVHVVLQYTKLNGIAIIKSSLLQIVLDCVILSETEKGKTVT